MILFPVPLGGLEWKEDCVQSTGGRNMKCLSWNEAKEKVVNVICMLKCEAKKLAASNSAMLKIKENRVCFLLKNTKYFPNHKELIFIPHCSLRYTTACFLFKIRDYYLCSQVVS